MWVMVFVFWQWSKFISMPFCVNCNWSYSHMMSWKKWATFRKRYFETNKNYNIQTSLIFVPDGWIWALLYDIYLVGVTMDLDEWPWKIIGRIGFMHHAIGKRELKMKLLPRNTKIGVKLAILWLASTWNSAYDPEKNIAPLLCHFKLCLSFRSHVWN